MNFRSIGKKRTVLAVLISLFLIRAMTTLQAQSVPTGTARTYGYAYYFEGSNRYPIRFAKVELWEASFIDTKIGTTTTNMDGYYELTITLTGSKNVYAKVFCESQRISCINWNSDFQEFPEKSL